MMLKKRAEEQMRLQRTRNCGIEDFIDKRLFLEHLKDKAGVKCLGALGRSIAIEKEMRRFRGLL